MYNSAFFAEIWEEVVTLHIPVDPEKLSRHVPDELELDLYEGRA